MKTRLPVGRTTPLLSAAAAALLTTFTAAPSLAQGEGATTAPAQTVNVRETIMVTARKREETLQEVPVTVTAVGGQTIERFNIDEVADLTAQVPTLNVQLGGSGSGAQVSLRGVGSSNISAAFDSAVALNFDGVQVSSMRVLQSAFFDIQQIEVLKGPQSLFFGKGSSAGVISIKSANPTDEFEAGGKLAYEFEERGYTAEAFVSGPITDELGFRLAASFNDVSRQYVNQALDPRTERKKGQENTLIRGTLQWDPADNFTANLKLNYNRHENDGAINDVVLDCQDNGVADVVTLGGGSINIPAGYECDHNRKKQWRFNGAPPLVVGGTPADSPQLNDGLPFGRSELIYGRLQWDWDITDDITLTSVTGYLDQSAQDNDWYSYGGFCATPADCPFYDPANPAFAAQGFTLPVADNLSFTAGGGITDHQLEQFTQEVRLATNYDAPVNFMLGFFYEDRNTEFNTNQYAVNFAFLVGPDLATGFTSDWFKRHLYDMRAISIFGEITWEITDRLELSGGVRWSDERKRNNIVVPYMHFGGPLIIGAVPQGFDTGDIIFKDSNLSPEATLSYRLTDDVNIYIAYKTGFKSGGIDNSALPSAALLGFASDDPDVRAEAASSLIYDSETAEGGEVGIKSQLFDGALQLNFTAYYYVFTDLQIQNFNPFIIQFATRNASELTNKGLELEYNWLTPVDGLTIFGSLAFTSTKFTKAFDPDPNDGVDLNLQGRRQSRAPKWSGNLAVDYRRPVGNGFEFGLTGNLQFSSSYFTNEDAFEDTVQKSFVTLNLALSFGDVDGVWDLAVVARNLTDKRAITTSGGRPFLVPGVGDDEVWNLTRGRQVFIEASFRY